jgi:hypothetical protein
MKKPLKNMMIFSIKALTKIHDEPILIASKEHKMTTNKKTRIEFGGVSPKAKFAEAAMYAEKNGGVVAVVATRTGADWDESDGVVGYARSWSEVQRVLHKNGYRILRSGGAVAGYRGEEMGEPGEDAVIIVTVFP